MQTFEDLVASRRDWIDHVLKPWCRQAALSDLREAEADWQNIAGRVDPEATLWTWAWGRFSALVHEGLHGMNETAEVCVMLRDGRLVRGYPDGRQSKQGRLVLVGPARSRAAGFEEFGPFTIDEIVSIAAP